MFNECVTIGHAGDVIRDHSGAALLVALFGSVRKFRWHLTDIFHEGREQLLQHDLYLARHREFLLVAVEVPVQELLQGQVLLGDFVRETDHAIACLANVVDRAGRQPFDVALRGLDQVGHDRVDHAADDLVDQPPVLEPRVFLMDLTIPGVE